MDAEEIHARLVQYRETRAELYRLCAELHERFGWTWERIAEETGVHVATIYRWLRRKG